MIQTAYILICLQINGYTDIDIHIGLGNEGFVSVRCFIKFTIRF